VGPGERERTCDARLKTDMLPPLEFSLLSRALTMIEPDPQVVLPSRRKTWMSITTRMLAGNIAFAAMTLPAGAQLSSHWQACTGNPGIDWDTQIRNCTALIQSGEELKENMAIAFYNRALAYENKEKYDLAIADFSEAIRLNPNDADFYLYRGLDRQRTGDKAGADADIAEAKRLNPNVGK
jgi:tetratricopeptide (TPR) repeat protein